MDTDSFILSVNTNDIIEDLKKLEVIFDFSNLDENHVLFSNKNKKSMGFFKIETPKNIWIDELIALRSEMYSINCGDDIKNNLKGVSKTQSKPIKLKNITIVYLVENIKKIVISILIDQLFMKYFFNKYNFYTSFV